MKRDLILIGAGGFAKSVIDSLDEKRFNIVGFIDDIKSGTHLGYPILSNDINKIENKENYCYFISIGSNEKRTYWYEKIVQNNLEVINVIDDTAILSTNITYGRGLFVGKLAVINSDVRIGENVILNTKSLLEHGVKVGNNVNVSTNTTINGDVRLEDNCFIGSSSVINGQLVVGKNSTIGSGSVVIKDIERNVVVAGIPARIIRRLDNE